MPFIRSTKRFCEGIGCVCWQPILQWTWDDLDGHDMRGVEARDDFAASRVSEQIVTSNRKALRLFGAAHMYRNRTGTIMDRLHHDPRAQALVVVPVAGPELPASSKSIRAGASTPVLLDNALARLEAADVLE